MCPALQSPGRKNVSYWPEDPKLPASALQRIAKLLARAGIASRREVERMIGEGRVAIAGRIVETPATLLASLHGVTVDGKPVKAPAPARLFRYHKPAGLLTAERDPKGRATIYDRLPKSLPRLMPVGRLDLNTEGLLLLTTDGELKRQLELPSTGVERSYRARVFGEVSQAQLEELIHGIEIEGVRYGSINANLERRTGRNGWVEMRLKEGKNREVRRVLEHLGLKVSRLIRTAYGPFGLGDLPAGAVDEIRQHDLVVFRKTLDSTKPVRPDDGAPLSPDNGMGAPSLSKGLPPFTLPGRRNGLRQAQPERDGGGEGEDHRRPVARPAADRAGGRCHATDQRPAPARACSRCSPAASAASRVSGSPISSPVAARSGSRRSRVAPGTAPSLKPTASRSTQSAPTSPVSVPKR